MERRVHQIREGRPVPCHFPVDHPNSVAVDQDVPRPQVPMAQDDGKLDAQSGRVVADAIEEAIHGRLPAEGSDEAVQWLVHVL